MTGLFISDLHLFSRRSVGLERWASLRTEMEKVESIVLGGDIFDFRWSHHGNLSQTLDAAGNWLDDLAQKNPFKEIVYVLGNHDCHIPMQQLLASLAESHSHFQWFEYYYQKGNNVFLHGDVLDAGTNRDELDEYRLQFASEPRSRGVIPNLIYDAVVGMRIHRLPSRWHHRPKRTWHRMSQYLHREGLTLENGIQNVYFGHTHQPIEQHFGEHNFFNPGSGIRHLHFRPCHFES